MNNGKNRWHLLGRVAGAGLLAATGAIHLDLYLTGYRTIPTIGWLFLLQVISAFVLAAGVLVTKSRLIAVSGALFALSTLGGYLLSLWIGLFNFKEVNTTAGVAAGVIEVASFAVLAAVALIPVDGPAGAQKRVPSSLDRVLPGVALRAGAVAAASIVAAALFGAALATTGSAATAATGRIELKTATIHGASVLTNAEGFTLYYFAPDTPTMSTCYGSCASYWPPVTGHPVAGPGVTGQIATIKRSDGSLQAVYDGHPLYTYIGDSSAGQANGNALDLNGGYWYEVSTSGAHGKVTTPTSLPPAHTVNAFITTLRKPVQIGSTVPANGDVNPYGIAVVPTSAGRLVKGDTLVSNFNDKANVQGTGTTLVEVSPSGKLSEFAKLSSLPAGDVCPGGVGLSTGLAILPGGWVVVGSVPAAGPSGAPANDDPVGCIIVLDSSGNVAETWSNPDINGPWDLTMSVQGDEAKVFVSNVLSRPAGDKTLPKTGTCTVARLDIALGAGVPRLTSTTLVGTGFPWEVNKATFVLGPAGLALGSNGVLYAAETLDNQITAIPDALSRTSPVADGSSTLTSGGALNAPLGMALAPNGDLLVTNGNDGDIVEITPQGRQIAKLTLVKNGAGDLFGIALSADGKGIVFVNDGANELDTASPAGN
jgi:predicted lipoprotein with Yx(FWY)xxD motif